MTVSYILVIQLAVASVMTAIILMVVANQLLTESSYFVYKAARFFAYLGLFLSCLGFILFLETLK